MQFKEETIMHGEILIKLLTAINWISFAATFIAWWIRKSNADNFRIKGIMSKVMYTALAIFGISTLALVGAMITA